MSKEHGSQNFHIITVKPSFKISYLGKSGMYLFFSCDFFILSRLFCSITFSSFMEKRKAFSCLGRQRTQHEIFREIDIDREGERWISTHNYSHMYIMYICIYTHLYSVGIDQRKGLSSRISF